MKTGLKILDACFAFDYLKLPTEDENRNKFILFELAFNMQQCVSSSFYFE